LNDVSEIHYSRELSQNKASPRGSQADSMFGKTVGTQSKDLLNQVQRELVNGPDSYEPGILPVSQAEYNDYY